MGTKTKKAIQSALLMLLAAAVAGAAPAGGGGRGRRAPAAGGEGSVVNPATPGSYLDPTYGFSLALPQLVVKPAGRIVAAYFEGAVEHFAQGDFAPNINVLVDSGHADLSKYIQDGQDRLRGMEDRRETIPAADSGEKPQFFQVSGHDAAIVDFQATMEGMRLEFLQLVVSGSDATYVITCTVPVEGAAKYHDAFMNSLKSFKLPG